MVLSDDISDDKIAICIAPGSPSIRPYQDTVCLPWTIGKAGEALLGSKADEWERWEETKSKWRPSLGSNGLYTFSPFALFVISDMSIPVRLTILAMAKFLTDESFRISEYSCD